MSLDVPLMSVGLDSLSATELARTIGERFHTAVPSTLLFDYPTLSSLVSFAVESGVAEMEAIPDDPGQIVDLRARAAGEHPMLKPARDSIFVSGEYATRFPCRSRAGLRRLVI